jgi:hypothetical protein
VDHRLRDRRQFGQLLGELDLHVGQRRAGVGQQVGLLEQRLDDMGMGVSLVDRAVAGDHVQIFHAVGVVEIDSFAAVEHRGLVFGEVGIGVVDAGKHLRCAIKIVFLSL